MSSSSTPRQRPPRQPPPPNTNPPHMIPQQAYYPHMPMNPQVPSQFQPPNPYQHFQAPPQNESQLLPQPQSHPHPQSQSIVQSDRKRKQPGVPPMAGMSTMSSSGLGESSGVGQQLEPAPDTSPTMPTPKKSRTNTPWSPVEERRLRLMRDAGNTWGEIAKSFPTRTEGSVKKHWYKDMHYAEFAENESQALLNAIKEYESSKWKVIGQKVGKPAKACEQYAKEHFQGKL